MEREGFIDVDGARLEYRRWAGASPPILLLHEALGSISIWRDFPARLAELTGRAVIAWSRRGYGNSDALVAPRGLDYIEREAHLVSHVMDALDLAEAHLFGHSDGASIAIVAAALFPGRVRSLVLEAPHITVGSHGGSGMEAAKRLYETTDWRRKLARHHKDPDAVFASWWDTWTSEAFSQWSIERFVCRVTAPVLIMQGERDEYYGFDHVDLIASHLQHVRTLQIVNCGHSPHRDREQLVLSETTAFLRSVEDDPAILKIL